MKMARHGVCAALLLFAGCATMDKSECETADWRMIGLEDGARGQPLTYLSRHRKACAEHGIAPNLARYERGHAAGLRQYCTPANGFKNGRAGRRYQGVCPPALEGGFVAGYETGLELHQLSSTIAQLRRDVRAMQTELAEFNDEQRGVETRLVSGSLSVTDRKILLDRFKQLQTEIAALEIDIRDAELEAARQQGEYDVLDAAHPY